MQEQEILDKLRDCIVSGDNNEIKRLSNAALDQGIDPYKALMEGCAKGMGVMSARYDEGKAFVPEILLSARAMYSAFEIFRPHLKADKVSTPGKIVLGVVEGDIHDIGKNIVKLLLEVGGFTVIDLGRNVTLKSFVENAKETRPNIIAMSALMTTSMVGMSEVITMMKDAGIRDNAKVMIGGAPISQQYADQIGADGYAQTGPGAIKMAETLMGRRR